MKNTLLTIILIIPALANADYLNCPCKVTKVTDGDTIHVLDQDSNRHKIRLSGIDAPEKRQAYGNRSTKNLASYIAGKNIEVEYNKKDRYGRIVGKLLLNGQDINLQQVKDGLAWHYKHYEREQSPADRKAYAEAENSARKERAGLWKDSKPIAPWLFRQKNKK